MHILEIILFTQTFFTAHCVAFTIRIWSFVAPDPCFCLCSSVLVCGCSRDLVVLVSLDLVFANRATGLHGACVMNLSVFDAYTKQCLHTATVSVPASPTAATHARTTVVFPTVFVPAPHLWWPHTLGSQPLYTATFTASVCDTGGLCPAVSSQVHTTFGIRNVSTRYDAPTGGRIFAVNGMWAWHACMRWCANLAHCQQRGFFPCSCAKTESNSTAFAASCNQEHACIVTLTVALIRVTLVVSTKGEKHTQCSFHGAFGRATVLDAVDPGAFA